MSEPGFDLQGASQWFAIKCNNRTWDLLEKTDRTPAEDLDMMHMAHASCFHWMQVGKPENEVRALCLVTGVYAAVGEGQAAVRFSAAGLELAEAHRDGLADWDWAFLYDAAARAHMVAGDTSIGLQWRKQAAEAGAAIEEAESREVFQQIFDSWPYATD